ncbi:MAG: dihydrolipoyl dehydrogenase [Candidatus Omnitrophica bacterium]|nr:dihydrolipoyl dehydrogenase [Candidatus Omnitrophota bacterium]
MQGYDVVVIGSGPGGYVAGLRSAQKGFKTAVIEQDKVGGVCLNLGCIPTKTLLESARQIDSLRKADEFGIKVNQFEVENAKIWERKERVVDNLRKGIEYLFKLKGVDLIKGRARLVNEETIAIEECSEEVKAKNIILATGSLPLELPHLKFDHKTILSSDDILEKGSLFSSLIIVGGGAIGCEFGSLFNSLGVKVTIVELLENILPHEDWEISHALELSFKKRGINIFTGRKIEEVNFGKEEVKVSLSDGKSIEAEKILVAVGRIPNSRNLGLEELGVYLRKGWIVTDDYLRTSVPNIFAVGDVIGEVLLAHVAMFQGERVVENIEGKNIKIDYKIAPNCIYTFPEIASVGIKESDLKKMNFDYSVGKFPFRALGKSHASGETEGFLKLVVDKKENIILGAQAIGPDVTNIISELVLAIKNRIKIKDILETIHPHPTFSEIVPETILASLNFSLHLV